MKRVPALFGAFLFAAALWAAVNLSNETQAALHIATEIVFPEGKTSRSPLPQTIKATVKATGWDLVQLLYAHPPACAVNLRELDFKNGEAVLRQRDILDHISFPSDARVLSLQPDSIFIALDDMIEKTVPVVADVVVECKDGFQQIGALQTAPEYVRIAGARSVVQGIADWHTEFQQLRGVTLPVQRDVPLSDSLRGLITLSQQSVAVAADVQETADKEFRSVPVRVVNAPPGVYVALEPPAVTVWLRSGAEVLARLSPADIRATVDYYALADKNPECAAIDVAVPPQTALLSRSPAVARWFVRFAR